MTACRKRILWLAACATFGSFLANVVVCETWHDALVRTTFFGCGALVIALASEDNR